VTSVFGRRRQRLLPRLLEQVECFVQTTPLVDVVPIQLGVLNRDDADGIIEIF
jgi:hypothetical protein